MNELINAFLFFLPAGVANMAPVIANKIPRLNSWKTPLDFGRTYRGRRIFGDNKTWRGLVSGIVLAAVVAQVESLLFYSVLPQDLVWFVAAGALMGFGAIVGDAVESFFKRQLDIKPGDGWFPFDQIDYIVGGLLAVSPFIQWYPALIVQVFFIYFGLHLITVYLGYLAGIRDKPI